MIKAYWNDEYFNILRKVYVKIFVSFCLFFFMVIAGVVSKL
jgi:hypothetical protein